MTRPPAPPVATLGALVVALSGCGAAAFQGEPEAAFAAAVEAHLGGNDVRGGDAAQVFLDASSPEDDRYDRAQLILAESLENLELTHAAAVTFLDVASSRRNPELIDRAVAGLERIVTLGPHDGQVIVDGFLASAEITGLQPSTTAFIAYIQGRDNARRGQLAWMEESFRRIPEESPYRVRAELVRAVRHLSVGERQEAVERLDRLLEQVEELPPDVQEELYLAMARLAMEEGRYRDAVDFFEEVKDAAPRRPTLLLEMAWAYFYSGRSRRALGLLVALDAPMYAQLIAPERFLLEALSLQRLCQFEPAQAAVIRLEERYREALADLHRGVPPHRSEALLEATRLRVKEPGSVIPFLARLRTERAHVADVAPAGGAMRTALEAFYAAAIAEAERREEEALREEAGNLAIELIDAEDGVRLVVHELSVALLRGRQRVDEGSGTTEAEVEPPGQDRVAYRFDGEFWTDELDDLEVVIPDRCLQ
ncbi:MAG: tetratricopeptide repeat protein [Sandaracinaceae bacterium]